MSSQTLNLGILAHVDAGKTSLTERLLFEHGAIHELGSVDSGTTQTDAGELERQRGITIRSAVASFTLGDLQVNLVDTPGHPDFIAEVERALSVLDAAVLVVSAVEGVQAQTRVLMQSLRRMRLPTLIFVNKIDRAGARDEGLFAEIRGRLTAAIVPMVRVEGLGTRGARVNVRSPADEDFQQELIELLADTDEDLLRRVVDGAVPEPDDLRSILEEHTRAARVHPVYCGSALSGAGTRELTDGIRRLLAPHRPSAGDARPCGTVFAIERGTGGEKVAYLRLFLGTLHDRRRVTFRRRTPGGGAEEYSGRVTGLQVVDPGGTRSGPLTAGNIAKIRGLPRVRVGDQLGEPHASTVAARFSPPILEAIVRPRRPGREPALHAALTRLADEDPLIRTRVTSGGATSVLLYGAVQREVLAERLEREFGIEAVFANAEPIYFERPAGTGYALHEFTPRGPNNFWQTLGIRIEQAPFGTGTTFTREAQLGLLPGAYHRAIEDSAKAALQQGLYGWEVTDCRVVVTEIGYEAPMTVAADFRSLTLTVLMRALRSAGSAVYEPSYNLQVEVPEDALSSVTGFLLSLGADVGRPTEAGSSWVIAGRIAARCLQDLAAALPGLTRGEGSIWHEPGIDRRVRGRAPVRPHFDGGPFDTNDVDAGFS